MDFGPATLIVTVSNRKSLTPAGGRPPPYFTAAASGGNRATPARMRSLNCPRARLMVSARVAGQEPLEGTWISSVTGCAAGLDDSRGVHTARSATLQSASP